MYKHEISLIKKKLSRRNTLLNIVRVINYLAIAMVIMNLFENNFAKELIQEGIGLKILPFQIAVILVCCVLLYKKPFYKKLYNTWYQPNVKSLDNFIWLDSNCFDYPDRLLEPDELIQFYFKCERYPELNTYISGKEITYYLAVNIELQLSCYYSVNQNEHSNKNI